MRPIPEAPDAYADPQDEESEADSLAGVSGMMNPDHPLLQRAQAALKKQLQESKLRVEGELREKTKLLNDAKSKRETVGVELFVSSSSSRSCRWTWSVHMSAIRTSQR